VNRHEKQFERAQTFVSRRRITDARLPVEARASVEKINVEVLPFAEPSAFSFVR
jgi:hypothetical protein